MACTKGFCRRLLLVATVTSLFAGLAISCVTSETVRDESTREVTPMGAADELPTATLERFMVTPPPPSAKSQATVSVIPQSVDTLPTAPPKHPTTVVVPEPAKPPPLSREYVDYEGSLFAALREVFGESYNLNGSHIAEIQGNALGIRNLFHLVTAPIGEYNLDTTSYYDWLVEYIGWQYGNMDSPSVDYKAHVRNQFDTILSRAESEVSTFFRVAEAVQEAQQPGSGIEVYGAYLYAPIIALHYSWGITNAAKRAIEVSWQNTVNEYYAFAYNNDSHETSFLSFLAAHREHFPYPYKRDHQSRPLPTVSPSPTAIAIPSAPSVRLDVPLEGTILYDRPLTEWFEEVVEEGWFSVEAGTFHIGMFLGEGRTRETWTNRDDFTDISASVDIRAIEVGSSSAGCIAVRQDVDSGEYQLCILGNGSTWATYDYLATDGVWRSETLLAAKLRAPADDPHRWTTLKIVAQGSRLWFLANDNLLGSVAHNGREAGHVAIQVTNWGTDRVEWEFLDLVIRDLQ